MSNTPFIVVHNCKTEDHQVFISERVCRMWAAVGVICHGTVIFISFTLIYPTWGAGSVSSFFMGPFMEFIKYLRSSFPQRFLIFFFVFHSDVKQDIKLIQFFTFCANKPGGILFWSNQTLTFWSIKMSCSGPFVGIKYLGAFANIILLLHAPTIFLSWIAFPSCPWWGHVCDRMCRGGSWQPCGKHRLRRMLVPGNQQHRRQLMCSSHRLWERVVDKLLLNSPN